MKRVLQVIYNLKDDIERDLCFFQYHNKNLTKQQEYKLDDIRTNINNLFKLLESYEIKTTDNALNIEREYVKTMLFKVFEFRFLKTVDEIQLNNFVDLIRHYMYNTKNSLFDILDTFERALNEKYNGYIPALLEDNNFNDYFNEYIVMM